MAVHNLPDDILYLVFEFVGFQNDFLRFKRHPLAHLAYVCKQWKAIVDHLIYYDLSILTPPGLDRLLCRLNSSVRVQDALATTRHVLISYEFGREIEWRHYDSSLVSDKLTDILSRLGGLESVVSRFALPSHSLTALFNTSGHRLKDLTLYVSILSFDATSAAGLGSLTALLRLHLIFVSGGRDEDTLPARLPGIVVPAREVAFRFDFSWRGSDALLEALRFPNLNRLEFIRHTSGIFRGTSSCFECLKAFLHRHSETITDLALFKLAQSDIDRCDFASSFPKLRTFSIVYRWPCFPPGIPTCLVILKLPIMHRHASHGYERWSADEEQWQFFQQVVHGRFPNLQQLCATQSDYPLDWSAIDEDPIADVPEKFKKFSAAMQGRGTQLVDICGRTYLPLR